MDDLGVPQVLGTLYIFVVFITPSNYRYRYLQHFTNLGLAQAASPTIRIRCIRRRRAMPSVSGLSQKRGAGWVLGVELVGFPHEVFSRAGPWMMGNLPIQKGRRQNRFQAPLFLIPTCTASLSTGGMPNFQTQVDIVCDIPIILRFPSKTQHIHMTIRIFPS